MLRNTYNILSFNFSFSDSFPPPHKERERLMPKRVDCAPYKTDIYYIRVNIKLLYTGYKRKVEQKFKDSCQIVNWNGYVH